MRRCSLLLAVIAGLMVIAAVGCGGADATLPEAASELDGAEKNGAETSVAETNVAEQDKDEQPNAESPARRQEKRVASYRPPFPDRSELFVPPSTGRRVARRTSNGFEETVELIGFVQVDKPDAADKLHAVLSIDGIVTPVALGDQKRGVQVISIQPPVAVLQRGRSRWPATLE